MTKSNSPVDLEMVIRHRQTASLRSKLKKTRGKEKIRHKLNIARWWQPKLQYDGWGKVHRVCSLQCVSCSYGPESCVCEEGLDNYFSNSLIIHKTTTNHCLYTTSRARVWIPNEKLDETLQRFGYNIQMSTHSRKNLYRPFVLVNRWFRNRIDNRRLFLVRSFGNPKPWLVHLHSKLKWKPVISSWTPKWHIPTKPFLSHSIAIVYKQ